jgi:hypothetical protein
MLEAERFGVYAAAFRFERGRWAAPVPGVAAVPGSPSAEQNQGHGYFS